MALGGVGAAEAGPRTQPTAAIIDSQSVETTAAGGRGGRKEKQVKGRKRHFRVDGEGHLRAVLVEAANRGDQDGARWVSTRWPALRKL